MRAIDFFCGGGGMTYGLRQAGIDVIAGIDLDPEARATYEWNNQSSVFLNRDLNRLPTKYLEEKLLLNPTAIMRYCLARVYEEEIKKERGIE